MQFRKRKIYRYFILPTLTIFIASSLINYSNVDISWLMNHAIVSIVCGAVLACIYSAWDTYKRRKSKT